MSDTKAKKEPFDRVRVGSVVIAIWENVDDDGKKSYSTGKPDRSYRDRSGKYHQASSYFPHNLLELAKAANLAYDRIAEIRRDSAAAVDADTEELEDEIPY